jgi:hypothetical protein
MVGAGSSSGGNGSEGDASLPSGNEGGTGGEDTSIPGLIDGGPPIFPDGGPIDYLLPCDDLTSVTLVVGEMIAVRLPEQSGLVIANSQGEIAGRIPSFGCALAVAVDEQARVAVVWQADGALALAMYKLGDAGYGEVSRAELGLGDTANVHGLAFAGETVVAGLQRIDIQRDTDIAFVGTDPCLRPLAVPWGAESAKPIFAEEHDDACVLDLRVVSGAVWWIWTDDIANLEQGLPESESYITRVADDVIGDVGLADAALPIAGSYVGHMAADELRASVLLSVGDDMYVQGLQEEGGVLMSGVTPLVDMYWDLLRTEFVLGVDAVTYLTEYDFFDDPMGQRLIRLRRQDGGTFAVEGQVATWSIAGGPGGAEELTEGSRFVVMSVGLRGDTDAGPRGRRLIVIDGDAFATSTPRVIDIQSFMPRELLASGDLFLATKNDLGHGATLAIQVDDDGFERARTSVQLTSCDGAATDPFEYRDSAVLRDQRLVVAAQNGLCITDLSDVTAPQQHWAAY